jgi:hypothetical protein
MVTSILNFNLRAAAGLSALAFLVALPVGATNLIMDGNFTGIPAGATQGTNGYWAAPVAGGAAPTGWSVEIPSPSNSPLDCVLTHPTNASITNSNGNVCGVAEGQNWGFRVALPAGGVPGGGNVFAMDAQSTGGNYTAPLYQQITGLTAGNMYALTFYASADQQSGFTQSITAQWGVDAYGGTALPPTSAASYSAVGSMMAPGAAWMLETFMFKAAASTETIAFLALSNDTTAGPPFALLSNVSLTATPEPGTMMLLGLGLLGIPVLRKRRKKKV